MEWWEFFVNYFESKGYNCMILQYEDDVKFIIYTNMHENYMINITLIECKPRFLFCTSTRYSDICTEDIKGSDIFTDDSPIRLLGKIQGFLLS